MKIGIDARMYGQSFTGIGRYSYELIRNIAELDSENSYVIFLRKEAFKNFELPNDRFKKVLADFPHYSLGEQTHFLKLLNSERLDLMHFTHFNAPIRYKRPFVVTIHDLTLSFFPGKKMTSWWRRFAYHLVIRTVTKKAKKILAVSEHTKKDLIETIHVPESKITVIYNGVSKEFSGTQPTARTDLMQKLGISKPYFLYTGVWRDHKNVVGMIEAFATFNESVGSQYQLVITGKHNPTYHEIPDTIKKLNVSGDVNLVGLVSEEDLYALYKNALAYVFPSFYEGFGLPPLEAMQCGTPVIASNASAIPEVIGEGNALFFDPNSVDDMKDSMKIISTDASVRQRLIDRGLERVKSFDWNKMTKQVLDVYKLYA